MTYNLRWRKAGMISVICHIFLFMGASYLSAHMPPAPATEEQYMELVLINERQVEKINYSIPSPVPTSSAEQSQGSPLPASSQVTPPSPRNTATTTATTSIVTTEGLTMTSVAAGEEGKNESPVTTSTGTSSGTSNTSQTGTKSSGINIIRPSILHKVDPIYPQSVRQAGIEGTVIIKIQILANGRSGNISIARSSQNDELDKAAITAVQQWSFVPAKDSDSGQAVACYTTIPISFHLK